MKTKRKTKWRKDALLAQLFGVNALKKGVVMNARQGVVSCEESSGNIAVVMSTYNGASYIAKQIDSIIDQDGSRPLIYVRDDGSTDGTVNVLERYEDAGAITLIKGNNLGVNGSFLECLREVPRSIEYIAFSDQDDVWHPDKIGRALDRLRAEDDETLLLYYSERNYCDFDLKNPKPSHLNKRGNSFCLSLFDNTCAGNTIVINRALADLFMRCGGDDFYYHDWWLELLATCFGRVIYDPEPTVEYRRLEKSVSPSGKRGLSLLAYRIREFLGKNKAKKISDQLSSFKRLFESEMSKGDREMIEVFTSDSRMPKVLFSKRLRQTLAGEVQLRLCFLLGLL